MATNQTTYTASLAAAVAGMLANGENKNVISRTVQDSGGIGFGKAAFRGTLDHGITATPAANTFMGISLIDPAQQATPAAPTADLYARYQSVPLLTNGVVWVAAGVAVADGEQVYVTSGGVFTNVATSNVIIPNAVFDATIGAAGLVPVRLGAPSVIPAA